MEIRTRAVEIDRCPATHPLTGKTCRAVLGAPDNVKELHDADDTRFVASRVAPRFGRRREVAPYVTCSEGHEWRAGGCVLYGGRGYFYTNLERIEWP